MKGKPKVTFADRESVFTAAQELLNRGIYPSVVQVRKQLGGGSDKTINEHLKEFRAVQEKGKLEKAKLVTSKSKEASELLENVYTQFYLVAEEASTTDRILTLETENEQLVNSIKELENELMGYQEMKGELEALRKAHEQSQTQFMATFEKQANENAELREQVKRLDNLINIPARKQA